MALEKKAVGKPHNLTCFVAADGNRSPFRQVLVREREAQNNMDGKCVATENVRIQLWHRALHVGYIS